MLAGKDTVLKLIPQGIEMCMVDMLLYHDKKLSRTGFYIEKDNLFNVKGSFSEEGMIENIAQSAALRSGWMSKIGAGETELAPSIGVIGAIKNFMLYRNPAINTSITTEVEVITEIFNATMVQGKIMQDDELLAECELKIFIQG